MKNWYKMAQDVSETEGALMTNSPAPAWAGVPATGRPGRFIDDPEKAKAYQQNVEQWKSDVRTNKIPTMIRDINTMFQGSLKRYPVERYTRDRGERDIQQRLLQRPFW